jgi:hypothetical protein
VERCIADVGMPDELDFSIKGCGVLATPAHCARPSYGGQDMCKWKKVRIRDEGLVLLSAEVVELMKMNALRMGTWTSRSLWGDDGKEQNVTAVGAARSSAEGVRAVDGGTQFNSATFC